VSYNKKLTFYPGMAELAYAADLKSAFHLEIWVRIPFPGPKKLPLKKEKKSGQ
jgi:hypothetical protein